MKIKRLIPITASSALVASFAPIALSSCGQYQFINILNGYKPATNPIDEHQFASIEEASQYYQKLDKNILAQDYLWSTAEYVRENLEFPQPVLPFKFKQIDQANMSLEDWWTQPYTDPFRKDLFLTSFGMVLQISGQTEPRQENNIPLGSYIPNSYAVIQLTTTVNKLPYTIRNKYVDSNKTDARWYLTLAEDSLLKTDQVWSVSSTITITYQMKQSHEQSITTLDKLGVYWCYDNIYDPQVDPQVSYLYTFVYDALVYGSYHLQNCTLAR